MLLGEDRFSNDVLVNIFTFLPAYVVVNELSNVNKQWRRIIKNSADKGSSKWRQSLKRKCDVFHYQWLWRELYKNRWRKEVNNDQSTSTSWRRRFEARLEKLCTCRSCHKKCPLIERTRRQPTLIKPCECDGFIHRVCHDNVRSGGISPWVLAGLFPANYCFKCKNLYRLEMIPSKAVLYQRTRQQIIFNGLCRLAIWFACLVIVALSSLFILKHFFSEVFGNSSYSIKSAVQATSVLFFFVVLISATIIEIIVLLSGRSSKSGGLSRHLWKQNDWKEVKSGVASPFSLIGAIVFLLLCSLLLYFLIPTIFKRYNRLLSTSYQVQNYPVEPKVYMTRRKQT